MTSGEDAAASRTGNGPANLATIRAAIIAAIKDAGYLHVPEGRRDHTTPAEALRLHALDYGRTETDIHGTRRSPGQVPRASLTHPLGKVLLPARRIFPSGCCKSGTGSVRSRYRASWEQTARKCSANWAARCLSILMELRVVPNALRRRCCRVERLLPCIRSFSRCTGLCCSQPIPLLCCQCR